MIYDRFQHLINALSSQFKSRTETEGRKHGVNYGVNLELSINNNTMWMSFFMGSERHDIAIPIPFEEAGVALIQQNEVTRAICPFWLEEEQRELDYIAAMHRIILDTPQGIVSSELIKITPYLQQMIYAFRNGNASIVAHKFQRAINDVVNKMPLHETAMNSYVMNNRLMFIDEAFDDLKSPSSKLEYKVEKANKYFERGWTAIGLSDSSLSEKNYMLKMDLRRLSPFGLRYHNPQRNLYSTLGMKGDELPALRSRSMQDLMDKGVTRKGWNLFTAFVDIPDIFEDQIMIDESFSNKFVDNDRRYQIFGSICVKEGQVIKTGDIIGIAPDQEPTIFKIKCDEAFCKKIVMSTTSVGGIMTGVYNVVISYKRYFREGFKVTNLHGNKGVVRLAKLGYAVDPRTGKERKIDLIVGAKSVAKRRNYGQLIEALVSCIMEAKNDERSSAFDAARKTLGIPVRETSQTKPEIFCDDWYMPIKDIKRTLCEYGFNSDATWKCNTYAGEVRAICGTVFWGCIKTPEDQVWQENATTNHNGKEVRTAGLKFSHVEFRAIETRFGENNPIVDEIMSYAQGTENLHELLKMVESKIGKYPVCTLFDISGVKPVDQTFGTIVPGQFISGTIVDEFFCPNGLLFKLPLPYQTLIDGKEKIVHEGSPLVYDQMSEEQRSKIKEVYTTDKLYFPEGILRKCWRHGTGKYGLSEIGVIINNVVTMSHKLMADINNPVNHRLYYNSIYTYFDKLSKILGGKRGEISEYAMAIRYPFSAKAVAVLSTTLPKNTVEIHRDMATKIGVSNGDIIITERFPCLGFMSVRPQKVRITDDASARYVIRVSGNSLVSQNLDFDGDVIFIAAFHTPSARAALMKEWTNPNKTCYEEIQRLNNRKGAPHIKEYDIDAFTIKPFNDLSRSEHAVIIEKNTGVKAQTGPIIALTYNIMRIVENSNIAKDKKMKVAIEVFLEKAAQSVFEQKHGGKSLYEIVIDGICTSDVEMLVEAGFQRGVTEKLCNIFIQRANTLGIFNLKVYHDKVKQSNGSNLISTIVRNQNKIYFASRSTLEVVTLLKSLQAPAVDIPSRMYKWVMSGKSVIKPTILDEMIINAKIESMGNEGFREACKTLCGVTNDLFVGKSNSTSHISNRLQKTMKKIIKGGYVYAHTYDFERD